MRKVLPTVLLALGSVGALSYGYYSYVKQSRHEERRNETLTARSFALPNGLSVELVAGPCGGSAALVVAFSLGADHDPPGHSGMTNLIERILAARAGAAHAKRTTASGSDHIVYSVVAAPEQLLPELDAIAAEVSRFELTQGELETARRQVLQDVAKRSGGDPSLTATTYAAESIQPSRGNGRRGGIAGEVNTIDRAAVENFWRAHVSPVNARIVIVGGIEPDKVRARIEKAFKTLPAGTRPALRSPGESTVHGTLVFGETPTSVVMAVPAPTPSDRAYPAFLILAARLSTEDSTSRGWAASYDPLALPETLFVTGPVRAGEGAEPAAARIVADARKVVALPLTRPEVASARDRYALFLGLRSLDPKTCAADPRALAIAHARRAQLGLEKLELARALEATSAAELIAAAEFFGPRRATTVIAGGAIR
jgi:hypothetical protein